MEETLEKFLEDIQKLAQAEILLDSIWAEIGPYNRGPISEELILKLRDFYDFDDSE